MERVDFLIACAHDLRLVALGEVAQIGRDVLALELRADDEVDAAYAIGQLLRLNLRVTAGHDDECVRIFAYQLAYLLAALGGGLFGHGAGINDK